MAEPKGYVDGHNIDKAARLDLQYIFPMPGVQSVGDDKTLRLVAGQDCTAIGAYAFAKTGPTGCDLRIEIQAKTGAAAWRTIINSTTFHINAGATTAEITDACEPLFKNDQLRVNIDQIGSGVAGSDVTVFLRVRF